jgi:hypothetical protein
LRHPCCFCSFVLSSEFHQRSSCESHSHLCAGECKKRPDVVSVSSLKSVYVTASEVSSAHDIRSAPSEYRMVLPLRYDVGHKSCVTTVAIGEGMDGDEPVMKSDSEFVRLEGSMFRPVTSIAQ